jgi:cyclophilin family peptidyl-prolyl cis-trans isomerase
MKRLSALFLIACGAFAQTPPPPKKAAAPATTPAAPAAPARDPGLYMIMNTSMGTMTAKLFEKEAPGTVKNFVDLARGNKMFKDAKGTMVKRPYFSNLLFHRVIPNFMIQTGDQTGTGSGDCGFTIKDEIVPSLAYNKPGMLGLARLAAPNTGACQFFITEVPYASLTGQYTIFGELVEGQDIVGKIARVPRDAEDKPRAPVRLISVTIQRVGPPPVTATPAKKATTAPKAAPKK